MHLCVDVAIFFLKHVANSLIEVTQVYVLYYRKLNHENKRKITHSFAREHENLY